MSGNHKHEPEFSKDGGFDMRLDGKFLCKHCNKYLELNNLGKEAKEINDD